MKKIFFIIFPLFALLLTGCNYAKTPVKNDSNTGITSENTIIGGEYFVDTQESSVKWSGSNLIKSHTGEVDISSGEIVFSQDDQFEGASFVIDMTTLTVNSGGDSLLSHLKNEDFFAVDKYPQAVLSIDSISKNDGSIYLMTGTLKIKNVENKITFPANISYESNTITADASFSIDRTDWDIRYNSGRFFDNLGDKAIKDAIDFDISIIAPKR